MNICPVVELGCTVGRIRLLGSGHAKQKTVRKKRNYAYTKMGKKSEMTVSHD